MYSVKLWLFCYTPELNLTSPVQKSPAAFRCVSTWPSVKHTSRNSDFRYVSSYFLFKARLEMVYSSGNAVTANLFIHSEFLDIYFYFTSCWLENLKKNSQLLVTTARAFFFFFLWWNYVRVVTLKRLIGRIDLINFPPTKYSFLTKCCQILSHNKPAAVPSSNVLMSNVAGKGTEQRRTQPILLYFKNSLVLFVSWWLSPVELSSLVLHVWSSISVLCVLFFFPF